MSNPLLELQKLVSEKKTATFTAKVTKVVGQKVTVLLSTGNKITVWGNAKVNDEVMIVGKQIVAVVNKESSQTFWVD